MDLYSIEKGIYDNIHPEGPEKLPLLHWTSLLIDEAAQATEPEAVLALNIVAPPPELQRHQQPLPTLVMAGDQNQLGPRTASRTKQLQASLFERLLARSIYQDHPLARSKQSKGVVRPLTVEMLPIIRPAFANLIRNYRSHLAIIAMPSALFYNDTLTPEADNTDMLAQWSGWRGRRWPVMFSCNTSPDEIEQDGGGWFNVGEARKACKYALSLVEEGLLAKEEICIMSPFSAQVKVLRQMARQSSFDLRDVNIGPVEAFQGLESRFVILCTTRSRERFLNQDLDLGFGIIHEARRFNVALTRARQGLVVLGHPALLARDKNWLQFMQFCRRNQLVDGPFDQHAVGHATPETTLVSRLERQLIFKDSLDCGKEGPLAAQERPT
ncbi:hypothetical protein K431DRAFT_280280 [Polychaeton citri CBS 116435]|uniref:DNA2/NAM7 helicase-like C-terminal domain-containing protein n=1 Tax=Polychaeton citri CBS 116435 TaxID=1314669 RepID=A0A9P4UUZ7_9PEZI|nr:hypothetical protein K431DRAFT_280280 [Polychaeton citri CBS 116435]